MIKKLKENKKGFTLVELIVVLVIIAILAALLVPALTGYIDKAKEKSIIAETRSAVMAAQTLVDEKYGDAAVGADSVKIGTADGIQFADITKLAEISGEITGAEVTKGKVTQLTYSNKGNTCVYTFTATDKGNYKVQ